MSFCVHADDAAPVEREDVVFCCFDPPEVLQLPEFFGVLFGKVICLREVLVDFVELPWCFIGIPVAAIRIPGDERGRRGHPSVVIEAAVAAELEVLRLAMAGRFGVVEREGEAGAFDRLLLHSV